MVLSAAGSIPTLPAAKSTRSRLSPPPPPKSLPSAANGAVTSFVKRFPTAFQTIRPTEKSGSSIDPLTGTSISMTPSLSVRMARPSFTGSDVTSGPGRSSPRVN